VDTNKKAESDRALQRAAELLRVARVDEAFAICQALLTDDPANGEALLFLAGFAHRQGDKQSTLTLLELAAQALPERANVHNNLGMARLELGQWSGAKGSFSRALELDPHYAKAYINLGVASDRLGQADNAVQALHAAIRCAPDLPDAHFNLANVTRDLAQAEESVAHFRRALALDPDYDAARSGLLFVLNYLDGQDPDAVFAEHLAYGRQRAATIAASVRWQNSPAPDRPLKIGYVSSDFLRHPVGDLLLPVLQRHDRRQYAVYCYANLHLRDDRTPLFTQACDGWREIGDLSDSAVAALIRDDAIDILVDLNGHTGGHRLSLFALKPAPLQASWLGYFNTTGLATMDYLVSDLVSTPVDGRQRFTETIVHLPLPHSRFPYLHPMQAPPVAQRSAGAGSVTFGSFNNLTKLTPHLIALWSRLLRALPSASLILKSKALCNDSVARRIRQAFQQQGVENERLILRANSAHLDMLAQYADIDIALDSFPYTGGMTTLEALSQGVPVLTLCGTSIIERQSASILTAIGLQDWIADTPDAYIEKAIHFANRPAALAALRNCLRERVKQSPLGDVVGFTRELEKCYRTIWRRYCVGDG
jgi:predicted O-linked N-acetylglucosamine transferase (SPINDLY family)